MHSFKSLLRSGAVFLLGVVLISTLIIYPYTHTESYHYQDGWVRDSMAGQLTTLICGASQAQRGIDPLVLDRELGGCTYNLGSPLMTMQGRYTLLKAEVERNPVDTVILELCYDTMGRARDEVGPEGDYYLLGRFTGFAPRARYFFASARLDEYADFYYDTLCRGIFSWKRTGQNAIGSSAHYTAKGFTPLESNPITPPAADRYNQEAIVTRIDEENRLYLEKILDLCQQHNIRVYMVSTPLSDGAILAYDQLDTIHKFYSDISADWGVPYYNFSLYQGKSTLFPDGTAYFDRNHLSAPAADAFSALLAQTVADSRAGQSVADRFYPDFKTAQQQEILPLYQ